MENFITKGHIKQHLLMNSVKIKMQQSYNLSILILGCCSLFYETPD